MKKYKLKQDWGPIEKGKVFEEYIVHKNFKVYVLEHDLNEIRIQESQIPMFLEHGIIEEVVVEYTKEDIKSFYLWLLRYHSINSCCCHEFNYYFNQWESQNNG